MKWQPLAAILVTLAVGCGDPEKPPIIPPRPFPPLEPIAALQTAYADRDYALLSRLVANVEGARFRFVLDEPLPGGQTDWDVATELSIHRRMFEPEEIAPPEPPLPDELWIVDIDIALTPQGEWVEAPEYYASAANPDGLDSERWVATKAVFAAYVFFQTQGETHYQVNGREMFVVIDDRTKSVGAEGNLLLWRWYDLGSEAVAPAAAGSRPSAWSAVKRLYRAPT